MLNTARGHIPLPAQCPSMEVTTVSPSPASHTQGDNTCGIDICSSASGLAGNGALLCLLSFCRNPITVCIFHLAVTDLIFLLSVVTFILLHLLEKVSCYTIMLQEYLRLFFLLSLFSYTTGFYLLTAITIKRCTFILCPLWYPCHRPWHLSGFLIVLLWALPFVTVVILCLTLKPQVSLTSMNALNFLLFAPAMVISSTIFFIEVKPASQQQQHKRLSIFILLTVLFVLPFTLPLSLWTLLQKFSYIIVSSPVVFLLACIHSIINPFICFSVGSCRRPCSMGSLRKALLRVFGDTEGHTACSNDPTMDIVLC
ncbi:mas-related G-protein coupled receptor member H-like [Onychostruthus taczanowskii]|uniref:mas-related G-protein coupled receptor member H-like n=1 Tax=Onychostruthus taczanowskii TaxID=356909 RepID=UPI001B800D14|nr:mas-related G-protein coupled receptor member H-like [Onychostruthus taczanowskii]XP_041266718.1 mas-related G-protein coupled receptor member H-like [Onychostruthus taczanowskii]XP_041266726.1 mas-related G-protein coupled receptor member H-like [Onychostruthus taczanowskii]